MSLLRPSIGASLLRASAPVARRATPAAVRYESKLATRETTAVSDETSKDLNKHFNQPDYTLPPDHASSQFTPVPKRVMDGSEEGIVTTPSSVLSGAPLELQSRTVRIFRPSKPATQSGTWHGHHWRIDWDILPKGHRWENPLMGWQSSADFMQGTSVSFKTKEDAIRFAEQQGYEYYVQEPNERKIAVKAYANNFLYTDKKLKHIRTK